VVKAARPCRLTPAHGHVCLTVVGVVCRYASSELVQLSLVSLCLCAAWLCGQLGLSEELGAFMAGEDTSCYCTGIGFSPETGHQPFCTGGLGSACRHQPMCIGRGVCLLWKRHCFYLVIHEAAPCKNHMCSAYACLSRARYG
jgi:hypothetical protein